VNTTPEAERHFFASLREMDRKPQTAGFFHGVGTWGAGPVSIDNMRRFMLDF